MTKQNLKDILQGVVTKIMPYRLGKQEGRYGYYRDGSDTLTSFDDGVNNYYYFDPAIAVPTDCRYTESETIVGSWTDGRPLYRKVVKYNSTISASDASIPCPIDNVKDIVSLRGLCTNQDGSCLQLPYVHYNTTYIVGCFWNNNTIGIRKGSGNTLSNIQMIVEYTKTTDDPDSFDISMVVATRSVRYIDEEVF